MTIQQTSFCTFRLKFKSSEVIINPTSKVKDGILVYSQENNPFLKYDNESSEQLVINSAGEYEANDVFILGEKVKKSDTFVYTINSENLSVGIVSFVNELEVLPEDLFEEIDILIINSGGGIFYTPKQADNIIQKLSPKICIVFGFKEQANKGPEDLLALEELKLEMPSSKQVEDKTLKILKEDIERSDNTEVYYFEV